MKRKGIFINAATSILVLFFTASIFSCNQQEGNDTEEQKPFGFTKNTYYCVKGQTIDLTLQGTDNYVYYQNDVKEVAVLYADEYTVFDNNGNPMTEKPISLGNPYLVDRKIKFDSIHTGVCKVVLNALPRGSKGNVAISCNVVVVGVIVKNYDEKFEKAKMQGNSMYYEYPTPISISNGGLVNLKALTAKFLPYGTGTNGVTYDFGSEVEYKVLFNEAYFSIDTDILSTIEDDQKENYATTKTEAVRVKSDSVGESHLMVAKNAEISSSAPSSGVPVTVTIYQKEHSPTCPPEVKAFATKSIIRFTLKP